MTILPFGILCLSTVRMMFVNKLFAGGYCGLSESGLFSKLCTVGFLVVCKCSYVLLQFIVMSYVDCGQMIVCAELSMMSCCIVC